VCGSHRWLLVFLLISCLHGLGSDPEQHPELTSAQLGTAHFPVACKPSVQNEFEHEVALLHSFWYVEAEKKFLEISSDDAQRAMAHWGIAMSLWPTRNAVSMGMGGNKEHQFHAMDFLVYAYLQSGHEAEAQKIIAEVKSMPLSRHMYSMKFNRIYYQANFEASYALELHEWGKAASLAPVAGGGSEDSAVTFLARALGAARTGQLADARKDIDEVKSIAKLMDQGRNGEADFLDRQTAEPLAGIAHAEGKDKDNEAITLLRPSRIRKRTVFVRRDTCPRTKSWLTCCSQPNARSKR